MTPSDQTTMRKLALIRAWIDCTEYDGLSPEDRVDAAIELKSELEDEASCEAQAQPVYQFKSRRAG